MDWKYEKFKLLILTIYLTIGFDIACGSSVEFVIKNAHTGKYIHPKTTKNIPNSDPLHLWTDAFTANTVHFFEPVDGIWGYIRNKLSGFVWHPKGGYGNSRREGTDLCLHPDQARWALFAIDQVNNHIIHRDGMYVEYSRGYDPYPPNGDPIELTRSVHDGMNWVFLNPKNLSETVYPYGTPRIAGQWELVFAVENPSATQTWEYVYTLGKSNTRSSRSSQEYHEGFEFTWEASITAQASFTAGIPAFGEVSAGYEASMGTSVGISSSLTTEIENSSEDTWYGESQEKSSITVEAGKTVVVWQRVFIGSQLGHKAVFHSNHFAYTNDVTVKPK